MNIWMKILFLFWMIFMHIVDDYYLQGILAQLKQKKWWEDNIPREKFDMYENDYKVALICHGFSWSMMVHIPVFVSMYIAKVDSIEYFACLLVWIIGMAAIHSTIDNAKANVHTINLVEDQILHLVFILITWGAFVVTIGYTK